MSIDAQKAMAIEKLLHDHLAQHNQILQIRAMNMAQAQQR
jgi:hypothetical protein